MYIRTHNHHLLRVTADRGDARDRSFSFPSIQMSPLRERQQHPSSVGAVPVFSLATSSRHSMNSGSGHGQRDLLTRKKSMHVRSMVVRTFSRFFSKDAPSESDSSPSFFTVYEPSKLLLFVAIMYLTIQVGGMWTLIQELGITTTAGQSLFLCVLLAVSSVQVGVRITSAMGHQNRIYYNAMISLLMIHDILFMFLLVLPSAVHEGMKGVLIVFQHIVYLIIPIFCVSHTTRYVSPILQRYFVHASNQADLFLLSLISWGLGAAMFTKYLGLPPELGAFLAGSMLSSNIDQRHAMETLSSVGDIFASFLFSSFGLIISPLFVWNNLATILELLGYALLIKMAGALLCLKLAGFSLRDSWFASVCCSSLNEFAILVAGNALKLGVLSRKNYLIFLSTNVASLMVVPLLWNISYLVLKRLDLATCSLSAPESHTFPKRYGKTLGII